MARTDTEAVSCLGPALRAYTALIYQGCVKSGSSVLIASGASADGSIAIQLALSWGAKVHSFQRSPHFHLLPVDILIHSVTSPHPIQGTVGEQNICPLSWNYRFISSSICRMGCYFPLLGNGCFFLHLQYITIIRYNPY